jgi:hypothetical protein
VTAVLGIDLSGFALDLFKMSRDPPEAIRELGRHDRAIDYNPSGKELR